MARTTTPLSDTQIRQAKPKDKEYNLVDGKGLSLRVRPNGSKIWLFNYTRPYTKKRNNLGLGQYPSTSLAQARSSRQHYLELLSQDIDPQKYRIQAEIEQKEAVENTLHAVFLKWFEIKKTKITSNYADDIRRSLELHIFPTLGAIPIDELTARNAIHSLMPLSSKGSLETVKRICQRLNEIMVYGVNTGLIEFNKLSGISKGFESPKKKHLPTIKPDELPEFMHNLSIASIDLTTRYLIEWQMHTMTRPNEAAGTKWEEIDLENLLWNIPAERMKKKKPHIVPLTKQALALLEGMKPISGHREHVFPGIKNPKTHLNPQTANMAIKRMGYYGKLVSHGLRSLASTILNEKGLDFDVIESALSHKDKNEVRAAYNRAEYIERRKDLMQWWSDYLETAAEGNLSLVRKMVK